MDLTTSKTVLELIPSRFYKITASVDVTVGIGPDPAGDVVLDDPGYAQYEAGVTNEVATTSTDIYLAAIAAQEGVMTVVNDRPWPDPPPPHLGG